MVRRSAAALAVAALLAALLVAAPSATSAAAVVPNAGLSSSSGWTVSSGVVSSFDRSRSALRVRARSAKAWTVTAASSRQGATVRSGTTVSIAGDVAASRSGLGVRVELREVHPRTGKTVQSAIARRTTGSGFQWYGAELTTRSSTSRIRVVVTMRATGGPTLALRGFRVRLGAPSTALWVPDSPARQWVAHASPSDPRRSAIDTGIARRANSMWMLGEENPYARLASWVGSAQASFATAVVTPYYVPRRWDGLSDEAGAPTLDAYRRYTDRIADAIGSARAVVVLEPDALWFYAQVKRRVAADGDYEQDGHAYTAADVSTRRSALAHAVKTYASLPRTTVYVDAGTSSGAVTPAEMAAALKSVGVGGPRTGFAVNVSSYAPEASITRWATEVRSELSRIGVRDARYVVDTGRNGNPFWTGHEPMSWCNPEGQRLGLVPGRSTAAQRAQGRDWNLWVKGPGESDGDCGVGPGTIGGQFMPDVAAELLGL